MSNLMSALQYIAFLTYTCTSFSHINDVLDCVFNVIFDVRTIPNESPSLQPPSSLGALGPTPATVKPLRLSGPPNGQSTQRWVQRIPTAYNGRSTKSAALYCS
jgi:hypothetical protein